jgi:hypothetical protein
MKTVDYVFAILVLVLGLLHCAAAPVFRGRYGVEGMWFLSGGLMLMMIGLMNLVRIASSAGSARAGAIVANLVGLGFTVGLFPLVSLRQDPQVLAGAVVLAVPTILSILRRPPRAA